MYAALPGVDEVARLLGRLAANAHTICDEELRPVSANGVEQRPNWALTFCMMGAVFGDDTRADTRGLQQGHSR